MGSPSDGWIYDMKNKFRKEWHYSIKSIILNRDIILKSNVSKSLQDKTKCRFWKQINELRLNDRYSANVIDGKCGAEEISNLFRDKYKNLYTEFSNNGKNILKELNENIKSKCNRKSCSLQIGHNISSNDVEKAIQNLKKNKKDSIYDLVSENFKNGTPLLSIYLSCIFNCILIHGSMDEKVNQSKIISIIKDKRKSISASNNYRGISLSTLISKLLELIILSKIKTFINPNDFQFGFREGFLTTLCASTMQQVVKYYLNGESSVYTIFLDASKAFDRVKHTKLFDCLIKRDICLLYIRLIYKMYLNSNAIFEWGDHQSSPFKLTNGIKRGGIISPQLFALYLDPLLYELQKSGYGCYMGHLACNVFAYADDVVLLAPTVRAVNKLLELCKNYSQSFEVDFNLEKT